MKQLAIWLFQTIAAFSWRHEVIVREVKVQATAHWLEQPEVRVRCCFGRGETTSRGELPGDRPYIIDCLSLCSLSCSSQWGNTPHRSLCFSLSLPPSPTHSLTHTHTHVHVTTHILVITFRVTCSNQSITFYFCGLNDKLQIVSLGWYNLYTFDTFWSQTLERSEEKLKKFWTRNHKNLLGKNNTGGILLPWRDLQ